VLALANDFALPVTWSLLGGPPGSALGERETIYALPIAPCVATFLLLAALDHLLCGVGRSRRWYERELAAGRNRARWFEYSLSASLMVVLIAMLTGISDIAALIGIFGANAAMILFGLLMENVNRSRQPVYWTPYLLGCLAGAVPWIAIAVQIAGSEAETGSVPTFVFAIFVSLFVLFNSFAVNMLLQYRRVGRWRSYLFGERGYLVLSLVAKSALAWQIFGSTLAT
jgi:hypothetical protein